MNKEIFGNETHINTSKERERVTSIIQSGTKYTIKLFDNDFQVISFLIIFACAQTWMNHIFCCDYLLGGIIATNIEMFIKNENKKKYFNQFHTLSLGICLILVTINNF